MIVGSSDSLDPRRGGVLKAALVLLLLAVVVCIPRALMGDWTGTEGRRVQVVEEMLASGDWMVPTLGLEPTLAKPPLFYWLQSISAECFGHSYFALRLPSIVLLWAASLLAFVLHGRAFGRQTGWVCALGVLLSPLAVSKFPTAEIDPTFACLTAMSLWLLAYGVARSRSGLVAVAGILGGLAMMTKGPVYLVFAAGSILVWWRHRRLRGITVFLASALVLPVAYYVGLASTISWDELGASASTETVGRLAAYRWRHIYELPGFWLRAIAVQLPFVLWCFWEFRSTRDARMGGEDLTLRMCSGGAVLAVLVLSVFPGKPTRYLLPNIPLFTFAVAPAVAHYARQTAMLGSISRATLRVLGLLGGVGLVALPFVPGPLAMRSPAILLVLGLAPVLVRTPRALVTLCLALPAVAAWTGLLDYQDRWVSGGRARAPHGPMVREEIERQMGTAVDVGQLQSWGHVNGPVLLGAGLAGPELIVPGHELAVRPPEAPWVLRERDSSKSPSGYEVRLVVCLRGETLVLEERTTR